MKIYSVLIVFLMSSLSFAQMLDNEHGKAFSEDPFFNTSFIKRNKIKKITGRYSTKAINDQIRDNANLYVYEFSEDGRLTQKYHTVQIGTILDTIVYQYFYHESGLVSILRKSDQYGFYATHFTYDTLGRVIIEEKRRDLNKNQDKLNFELGQALVFSQETSSHFDGPLQSKRTFYNNYDRPFKDHFKYFNEDGYLLKEETIMRMTRSRTVLDYSYDDKGFVSEIDKTTTLKGSKPSKQEFFYDELNNLEQVKYYRGEVYTTEKQMLYNKKSRLLKTVLTRDVATQMITILALDEYEFYD
jgi:hypothetical protein